MGRSPAKIVDENPNVDESIDETPVIEGVDTWEWDTVSKESPIGVTFDTIGDVFIGKFTGRELITPDKDDPFEILTFEDSRGKRYAVSPSYKLDRAFAEGNIPLESWCRITYVAAIETGNKEPMKDFRVDVRKA